MARPKGSRNQTRKRGLRPDGYIRRFEPEHPLAGRDGHVLEHRMVVFDAGIDVPTGSHVHHLNGDRSDNRLENLAVLAESDHHRHHIAEMPFIVNQFGVWPKRGDATCSLQGCDIITKARGLCNGHYLKWHRGRIHVDGLEDQPYRSSHGKKAS